jgi:hypothetical protein
MTDEQIVRAQRLWAQGNNTFTIGMICRVPESDVYNRIAQIKNTPAPEAKKSLGLVKADF